MTDSSTQRQQRLVSLAAQHADDFRTRVTQHDRENSFPHENMKALQESGYSHIPAPEEFGGGGASVEELCLSPRSASPTGMRPPRSR